MTRPLTEKRRAYMKIYNKNYHKLRGKEIIEKQKPYQKKWRAAHKEYTKTFNDSYYKNNKQKFRDNTRNYLRRIRIETLVAYSNDGIPKCVCCGEREINFLTFDHINNDGAEHRKIPAVKSSLALWLRKNSYPKIIQILCYNCNLAKAFYGVCPHIKNQTLEKMGLFKACLTE